MKENDRENTMKENDNSKVVMFDTENSIILGDYLDLLLNRTMDSEEMYGEGGADGIYISYENDKPIQSTASKLGKYEYIRYAKSSQKLCSNKKGKTDFIYSGGIRTPHYCEEKKMDEGSGNIVISGKPGVGKSTLAFQFAAACVSKFNEGISVYFSLDVDEKQIVKSMKRSGGDLKVNFLCDYLSEGYGTSTLNDTGSNEELEAMFRNVLYKNEKGKIVPQIILPKLSPRGITPDLNAKEDAIFVQRISELQKLLRAVSIYNAGQRNKNIENREPMVKLVVIDSLDVFGERTLTREEISRLFMLFKQYGIIGVFTMGYVGYESLTSEALYRAAVAYQADVVIELKKEFYNNYTCSYFEIVKSRYIRHVLGHHPYKVENYQKSSEENVENKFFFSNTDIAKKIVVLPSLHYRISASENSVLSSSSEPQKTDVKEDERRKTIFGIKNIEHILPNHFLERRMDLPQIITISGSSGLFKSDIALNALLSGILPSAGDPEERGLIVRLGDRDAFAVRGIRFEKGLLERFKEETGQNKDDNQLYFYEKDEKVIHNDEPNKYTLKGWTIKKEVAEPQLLEVTFKNGALLPEEFVDEICKIINTYKIRRVVFTDLKYIGSSYPFLVNSDTSGNLFLSAFIHIMRNYGMHVIMSSSESGLEASDVELKKAGILADAILTCKVKTEKDKKEKDKKECMHEVVYIMGEGLITKKNIKGAIISIDDNQYTLHFCSDLESQENEHHNVVKLCPFEIKVLVRKDLLINNF